MVHLHLPRLEGNFLLANFPVLNEIIVALTLLPEVVEFD